MNGCKYKVILLGFACESLVQRSRHRPSTLRDGSKYAGSMLAYIPSDPPATFEGIQRLVGAISLEGNCSTISCLENREPTQQIQLYICGTPLINLRWNTPLPVSSTSDGDMESFKSRRHILQAEFNMKHALFCSDGATSSEQQR